ncbi:endoxylanase, partial [Salmonella enterica subsp. enterica]|nr:endoxylanase [Salmonella enterica subsp. enterica serovar Enteritidis]
RGLFIGLAAAVSTFLSAPVHAGSTYDVVKVSKAPTLDGKADDTVWQEAGLLEGGFHFPWEQVHAPRTQFRAVHDGANFYFSFVVVDPDVVVLDQPKGERETVDEEDRVELFFSAGPIDKPVDYEMPAYYAVEVDPAGRVHDYSMKYYRQIDSAWKLDGFKTAGARTPDGYIVEASIPLSALRGLGLLKPDGSLRAGAFRAEFSRKDGKLDQRWISWVDPQTPVPDFHVDSAFGLFRLIDAKN